VAWERRRPGGEVLLQAMAMKLAGETPALPGLRVQFPPDIISFHEFRGKKTVANAEFSTLSQANLPGNHIRRFTCAASWLAFTRVFAALGSSGHDSIDQFPSR